jgi:predicted ATPase/DNA-binding CsgD family transcriptional regulator
LHALVSKRIEFDSLIQFDKELKNALLDSRPSECQPMIGPFSPVAPLIGRESERASVRSALLEHNVRLLTLTGPGGIGKTHLAHVLMDELRHDFADGAYFVSLGSVRDPELVLAAVARAIGLRDPGSLPLDTELQVKLSTAEILLILDNLEQVVAVVPHLVELIEAAPGVRILATSRTPLRAPSEQLLPVPPLQVPDPNPSHPPPLDALAAIESVQLLTRRAQAADPEFTVTAANAAAIATICTRLEGLPLAIELAAARLQVLSPDALLERLARPLDVLARSDPRLPERHQALRNTIAWSEELLSPSTRMLFRCLSVFTNGCDAAAAEAICGDPPGHRTPSCRVIDGLAELLDHGFMRREVAAGVPRFTMPETICEYALQMLEGAGELEATRRRHADHFLALAEEAAPELLGPDQEVWSARLESEHDNLRAALRWSAAQHPCTALRLAAALWRFWYAQEYLREGRAWLEQALATPAGPNSVERVRALNGLGVLSWAMGDPDRALALQDQSFTLARDIGDRWGMTAAKGDRAIVAFEIGGSATQAREATEHVLNEFRALADRYGEGLALTALGNFAQSEGGLDEAVIRFQEALAIARQIGDIRSQTLCLSNLAQTTRLKGNFDQAAAFAREGLELGHRLGNREDMVYGLLAIGGLAVERHQFAHAARLLGAAAAAADAFGIVLQPAEKSQFDHDVMTAQAALAAAPFTRAWDAGRALPLEEAVARALREPSPSHHRRNGHSPLDHDPTEYGLSRRELEVLRLLAAGMSDREIAAALFISAETATTHVKRIRGKLGVRSRPAAAAFATRHGLD